MHKKTGELAIVRRVWLEADLPGPDESHSFKIRIDVGIQSWAFQNKHGVVLLLPTNIQDQFEDLGEL